MKWKKFRTSMTTAKLNYQTRRALVGEVTENPAITWTELLYRDGRGRQEDKQNSINQAFMEDRLDGSLFEWI